jgi:RluA family pseudouridine synthase
VSPPKKTAPEASGAPLVDEGTHHAVFVKPAGMTVVAGRGVPRPTLLDVAQQRFPGARPVHRLDRVTHGLCIVAKSPFGQQALTEAFRRHLVDKRYLAVVEGQPGWDKLDIDARLARIDDPDARKGPLAWQTVDPNGIRALTRVRVLARGEGIALVEARPETGRMHQIRCHLAHVGHPIVGDTLYGAKTPWLDDKSVALLALAVSFPLPQGGRAFVTAPLPPTWKAALERARVDVRPVEALVTKFRERPSAPPAPKGPREHAPRPSGRPGPRGPKGHAKPGPPRSGKPGRHKGPKGRPR